MVHVDKEANCIFDTGHPVLLAIYTILNLVLFISVISIIIQTIRRYVKEQDPDKKPKLILMIEGLLFNIVTALCIVWLLIMGILKAQSDIFGSNLNPIYYWFHEIFVLFYGKQGCLLLLFLFTRLTLAFDKSVYKLKIYTIIFFNALFLTSLAIFTYVPLFGSTQSTEKSFWVICSSSLCFFNLFTMSSMTILFISKLVKVYKQTSGSSGKNNSLFVKLITKLSLLGMISICITATNCTLLILRYTFKNHNFGLIMTSNLLIPIDIWTNWICVILSYAVFDKYYYKYCGKCDSMSQKCMFSIFFHGSDEARCAEIIDHGNNQYNSSKSKSIGRSSEASMLTVPKAEFTKSGVPTDGPTIGRLTSDSCLTVSVNVDNHPRISTFSEMDLTLATITGDDEEENEDENDDGNDDENDEPIIITSNTLESDKL